MKKFLSIIILLFSFILTAKSQTTKMLISKDTINLSKRIDNITLSQVLNAGSNLDTAVYISGNQKNLTINGLNKLDIITGDTTQQQNFSELYKANNYISWGINSQRGYTSSYLEMFKGRVDITIQDSLIPQSNIVSIGIDSTSANKRISYTSDLSSTFTDNTLVTKKYVDGKSPTLSQVLRAGSNLDTSRTIAISGNVLTIDATDTTTGNNTTTQQSSGRWGIEHFDGVNNNFYRFGLGNGGIYLSNGNDSISSELDFTPDQGVYFSESHRIKTGIKYDNPDTSQWLPNTLVTKGWVQAQMPPQKLTSYTVATLPTTGIAGRTAYVTDALNPTYLGTLIGNGTTKCPVFDNGTAWVAH